MYLNRMTRGRKLIPTVYFRRRGTTTVGLKSCVASGQANLLEWRDVKVLGTCLYSNRYTLDTQKAQNGHDTAGRYLRFVNQLPNLPQVQHLGSVIRGFVPRRTLCSGTNTGTKPWTLEKVNSLLTSRSLQEAERPTTRLTGKVTTGNAAATSTSVEQHWSCSFCPLSWAAAAAEPDTLTQLRVFRRQFSSDCLLSVHTAQQRC